MVTRGLMSLGPDDLVLCAGTLPRHTTFVDRVDAASAAGFAGISLWGRDYQAARREGHSDADVRARLADHGLAVAELDPAWWWTPVTFDAPSLASIDDMEVFCNGEAELFAIADAVGARSINAVDVLGGRWSIDDAAEALAGFCDRAAEHGLLVHVEFLPWSRIADVATAWEVVRLAGRANAGIAVDAWHWFRGPSDDAALRSVPGAKIMAVQLGDAPADSEPDPMTASLHERLLPGDGDVDLVNLVAALREAGAVAPIGVEVFSDALHALGPHEAARRAGDAVRRILATRVERS
jgi:sugar phosphate isomerase/epimerase